MKDQRIDELERLRRKIAEYENVDAERRRAEEAVKKSEEYFRALIENTLDIIMIDDAEGVVQYISPSVKPVLGYEPEEVVGSSGFAYVHPDDFAQVAETFAMGLQSQGAILKVDMRGRHKDGSWRHLEVTGHNLLQHPAVEGIVVNFRDITERKQAEEALRESEERHRLVFENVNDVIGIIDGELKITSVSPSVEHVLGYRPDEMIGRGVQEFRDLTTSSLEMIVADGQRVLAGKRITRVHDVLARDGTRKYCEASVSPLIREGRVVAALVVGRDITERVNYENKLKSISRKVLVAQEEERTRLARDLHDDLGQLLTAIQLEVGRLKTTSVQSHPEILAQIDGIVENIEGAAKSLRRIWSGLRPPLLDDLGLVSALEAHARDFETRWGFGVTFQSSIESTGLSPLAEVSLFRIAQEALTNVLRHAGETRVSITLERIDQSVVIRIRDNGRGFSEEAVSKKDTSGLYGMRERAELCGGRLEIESAPGKGTTVRACLPMDIDSMEAKS